MAKTTTRTWITAGLVSTIVLFTIGILLGSAFIYSENVISIEAYTLEQTNSSAFWKERIRLLGGQNAYNAFVSLTATSTLSSAQQHLRAHLFGGALYEVLGDQGLSVCGYDFLYGCFHEFLGRAIADAGIDAVFRLNDVCIDTFGPKASFCQHGIGHGIQTHFGYTYEDLTQALALCERLSGNDPIGGCAGGIYMEYNFQTMLGEDAQIRTSKNVFAPCSNFSGERKRACVFWQPQWWWQSLFSNATTSTTVAQIGSLCREIAGGSSVLRRACFKGIGNIAVARGNFNVSSIRRMCDATATNEQQRLWCHSYAADSIAQSRGIEKGIRVCEGLRTDTQTQCKDFVRKHFPQKGTIPQSQ